jgi:hypothetical protein
MVTCPKCGFSVAESAAECPACGVILAKVRALPPPRAPESPYEPPAAAFREPEPPALAAAAPPPPPAGTEGEISPRTLEALQDMRPWLRFMVGYGFVVLILIALGAVGTLLVSLKNPQMLSISLVYGFYAVIGWVFLLPLRRAAEAIRRLPDLGSRATVETFVAEQGAFWRRTGLFTAVMLCLAVFAVVLAILFGGLAAMKQMSGS